MKQASFGLYSLDKQELKKNIDILMSSKHTQATKETADKCYNLF